MLWLTQRHLAPHVGMVSTKDVPHILELARAFDLLTTGYALSEKGVLLQNYLNQVAPGIQDGSPEANPFDFPPNHTITYLFLYTLLSVNVLTPFLLEQFAMTPEGDPKNAPGSSAARLSDCSNSSRDRAISPASTTFGLVEPWQNALSAKGVAKNQAQPRYHHLFELGLLKRLSSERGAVPYAACESGMRATDVLQPLRENPQGQQDLIDRNFFGWASQIRHPGPDLHRRTKATSLLREGISVPPERDWLYTRPDDRRHGMPASRSKMDGSSRSPTCSASCSGWRRAPGALP